MIDSPPHVMGFAVDLHEDLVQMPLPVRMGSHRADPIPADLRCEHRSKSVPPEPDRLVADIDPPLMQQIFNIAK